MTDKELEVINIFISVGKRWLKENKHFHLEPILQEIPYKQYNNLKKKIR